MSSKATGVQEASPKYGFTAAKPAVSVGYKQTEVGMIPEDWELKQLCEITQIRSGIAKNSSAQVQYPIHVHYLRVANVQDGYLDLSDMSQITISRSDLARFSVQSGDVLMNEGGDRDKLGRGAIWRGQYQPCIHQNHVFVVRPKKVVDPEYLAFWSAGDEARKYFLIAGRQTTNLASINKTSLGQLPVVLPRVSEQRAISAALSDVDALLEELDRLIAKKRDIKQATMQQLLTGQTRLPGFDGKWKTRQLNNYCRLKSGVAITSTSIAENFQYPCYGGNGLRGYASTFTHDGGYALIGRQGALCGNVTFVSGKFFASEHALVVSAEPDTDIRWLAIILERMNLNQYSESSAQPGLSSGKLMLLEVCGPTLRAEQKAIAKVLSDMQSEAEALENHRAKTASLKQAMMQELLTGRTRLVNSAD